MPGFGGLRNNSPPKPHTLSPPMNTINIVIKWTSALALVGSGLLGQIWGSWRKGYWLGITQTELIFFPIPTCLSLLLTSLIALIFFFVFDDLEVPGHCILWSLYYTLSNRNLGSQGLWARVWWKNLTVHFLGRALTEKKGEEECSRSVRFELLCWRQSLREDGQASSGGLICTEMKLDLGWCGSSRVQSIIHWGGEVLRQGRRLEGGFSW